MSGAPSGRHFVLACHNAGGSIPPMLALAQEMVARGHSVTMLSQPSVRSRAEAAGCRFVPFDRLADYDSRIAIEAQLDLAMVATVGPEIGQQLLELLETEPVDTVVVDCNLAGAAAAVERAAVPSVVLFHCMYRSFTDVWFADLWPFLVSPINDTRRAFGLGAAGSWTDVFAAHDRLLAVVPASFDAPVAALPERFRHFGFLVPKPSPGVAASVFPAGDDPTVLVSLSTTFQDQRSLLRPIVEALAGRPVRALVTTSGQVSADELSALPNVAVRDYVEHGLLLDATDALITHAGLGTVAAALSYGVPMVCVPVGRDQHVNAQRVADCGAGVALGPEATPVEVGAALDVVLADERFRDSARAIGAESVRSGGAVAAVDDLERLLRPPAG